MILAAYCMLIALGMVLLLLFGATLYYRRRRKTHMTRRYARMLYHNGLISMEELNRWCAALPPDPPHYFDEETNGKSA